MSLNKGNVWNSTLKKKKEGKGSARQMHREFHQSPLYWAPAFLRDVLHGEMSANVTTETADLSVVRLISVG